MKRICPEPGISPRAHSLHPSLPPAQQPIVVEGTRIPPDLTRRIMEYLDPDSLSKLSRVSRAWCAEAQEVVLKPRPSTVSLAPFGHYPDRIDLSKIQRCFSDPQTEALAAGTKQAEEYCRLGLLPAGRRFHAIACDDNQLNLPVSSELDGLSSLLSVPGWQVLSVTVKDSKEVNKILSTWAEWARHSRRTESAEWKNRSLRLEFDYFSECLQESIDTDLDDLEVQSVILTHAMQLSALKGTLKNIKVFEIACNCFTSLPEVNLISQRLPIGVELILHDVDDCIRQLIATRPDIVDLSVTNRSTCMLFNEQDYGGVLQAHTRSLHLDSVWLDLETLTDIFSGASAQSLRHLRLSSVDVTDFKVFARVLRQIPRLETLTLIDFNPVITDDLPDRTILAKVVEWEGTLRDIARAKGFSLHIG